MLKLAENQSKEDSKKNPPQNEIKQPKLENTWSIRPCDVYQDEYDECTSFKARFHQYFINGESTDCTQWKIDYGNCLRYVKSDGQDLQAGQAIIDSEKDRRMKRLAAHYGNTTWQKREQKPPENWGAPLPDWLEKRNENTYLQIKQMEMEGLRPMQQDLKSYCSIM